MIFIAVNKLTRNLSSTIEQIHIARIEQENESLIRT